MDNNMVKEEKIETVNEEQGVVKNTSKTAKKNFLQVIKYVLVAASAGIIQFGSFAILTYTIPDNIGNMWFIVDMPKSTFISTTVALFLSVLWNFTFNRKITFKSAGNVPRAMCLALLFYVPFYPFQTWYVHTVGTAINPTAEWASLIAEATVLIINLVTEFCWQKFVIYRKEENTAVSQKDKKKQGE